MCQGWVGRCGKKWLRVTLVHSPDDVVQEGVHQAAQQREAPGWLVPHSTEQWQLLEDGGGTMVLELLGQLWRQIQD